ncbi:MAG: hypothetical protein HKL80_06650 [Acidimicrobiales bacterium]|nr:hypothetical protein [Acidimicrobiales bacterium]
MHIDRISVTMDSWLKESVRDASTRDGVSISTWIRATASEKLSRELLGAALEVWEAESTPFCDVELKRAAKTLGISRRVKTS